MIKLAIIQALTYFTSLYCLYHLLHGVFTTLIEGNLKLYTHDSILEQLHIDPQELTTEMIEGLKAACRASVQFKVNCLVVIVMFIGSMMFSVLRILLVYVGTQLKRDQKKAEEE